MTEPRTQRECTPVSVTCSPGGHPHADRPNWQPADNINDYVRNCHEGLESWSDRRAAKLLGWSRARLWRAQQMANIPEDLFDRLLDQAHMPSTKELAAIGQALVRGRVGESIERCPHCGLAIRIRSGVRPASLKIVNDWLRGAQ
jgi:hypothetical protein